MKPSVLRRTFFLLACCLLPVSAVAAELAITSATVHVGNGEVIEDATVLVSGGQITAVGGKADVEIRPGMQRLDAKGLHLIPGMIDLRSLELVPESTAPFGINSRIAVVDGLDLFERWGPVRAEGVTTVAVSGAGGSTQSSLGAILKLRRAVAGPVSLESLLLKRESHIVLSLGIAGTTSTSAQRLEQYYALRRQMAAALKYTEAWEKYWKEAEKYNKAAEKFNAGVKKAAEAAEQKKKEEKKDAGPSAVEEKKDPKDPAKKPTPAKAAPKPPKPPKRPKVDLAIEAMSRALKGELTVFIEAHRADDVRYALRLHEEFKFDFTLLGAGRAGPVAKELAASGITVALGPVLNTANDLRRDMKTERLAGVYARAGIPLVISSGAASAESSRYLRMEACAAVRGGLDPEKALEALTLQPAKRLGLEKKTGSIEKGKDADLVLLDGPPLDIRSRVVSVFVDGAAGMDVPVAAGQRARGPEAGLSFAPIE
ncbi:MAG: amidohydrolase family protein, partial [Planctomycetota bacterium]|nr:amidohydrolase family protein [Planctomycetota bacterium]